MARVRNGRGHSSSSATFQKQTVSISLEGDIAGALEQFANDIKEKALRPAAYAAAHEIYAEMKLCAPVYSGPIYTNKTGKRAGEVNAKPGQLRDAIYHWHDDKKSNANTQIYMIGVNKKKAPHWYFLEYGTPKMAARPYIRRSWDNKHVEALKAAKAVLAEKIGELFDERVAA